MIAWLGDPVIAKMLAYMVLSEDRVEKDLMGEEIRYQYARVSYLGKVCTYQTQ